MKIAFSQTIKPLALAPLAGLVVLLALVLRHAGMAALTAGPLLALRMAPFFYGATVVFAVPVLALWPNTRQPASWLAAIYGVVSACAAFAIVAWFLGQRPQVNWDTAPLVAAGAVSGLVYALVARRIARN